MHLLSLVAGLVFLPTERRSLILSFGQPSGGYTWFEIDWPGSAPAYVAGEYLVKTGTATATPTPPVVSSPTPTRTPTATATTPNGAWPPGSQVRTTTSLNFRSGPTTSSSIISTLSSGTVCTVNSGPTVNAFTWYNLTCPGLPTGWAAGEYLRLVASSSSVDGASVNSQPTTPNDPEVLSPTAVPTEVVLPSPGVEPPATMTMEPTLMPATEEPTVESVPVEENTAVAAEPVLVEPQPYGIARVQRTDGSVNGKLLVDQDPSTVWQTDGTSIQPIASFALDLDSVLPVGVLRYLPGAGGEQGRLLIHVSSDGATWSEITSEPIVREDGWIEIGINTEARFVRFAFINEDERLSLGGIAEVEVWPPDQE